LVHLLSLLTTTVNLMRGVGVLIIVLIIWVRILVIIAISAPLVREVLVVILAFVRQLMVFEGLQAAEVFSRIS